MSWSAKSYLKFAMHHQIVSLWQIANWITYTGDTSNIFDLQSGSIVDLGAGPGHISHMVAVLRGQVIDAAVQNEEFMHLSQSLPLPRQLLAPELVRLHIDPDGELSWLEQPARMVFCYASLHEFHDPALVIRQAYDKLAPEGIMLVVDTMRECTTEVERLLEASTLSPAYRRAVLETFASSLSLEEVREIFSLLSKNALVGPLIIDDELLFESAINLPVEIHESEGISFSRPTLFSALCFKEK